MSIDLHPATILVLVNGHSVSEQFYDWIRLQVEQRIPLLEPTGRYTLKIICGDDFWDLLTDGERRTAGVCMSDMVDRNLLPLCCVTARYQYPKRYQPQ